MTTNTYVALDKVIVGTATPSITFSNIPQTYTDLVLIASPFTSIDGRDFRMRFNGDTGTNYSYTHLGGYTSATSGRGTNLGYIQIGNFIGTSSVYPAHLTTHIQGYSNTSTYKTSLTQHSQFQVNVNSGYSESMIQANLWRSQSAITSITMSLSNGDYSVGSTFTLYGILAEGVTPTTKATGGAVYDDATYYYHVFGASGTFTPTQSITADILVVAGGGSGGQSYGGGGGAGGLLGFTSQALTATGYSVTVGAGGAATNATGSGDIQGNNGSNSQFASLTAAVGGGGGGGDYGNVAYAGKNGGSGGGGSSAGGGNGSAGTGTAGQGYAGAAGVGTYGVNSSGGGGGGAGGAGSNGLGGVGSSAYSSWVIATGAGQVVDGVGYIAGGGGGNQYYPQSINYGGLGGGGLGIGGFDSSTPTVAASGLAGTGSGGGGYGGGYGRGGSGVVIVRYAK
jgi:hypothetical protein